MMNSVSSRMLTLLSILSFYCVYPLGERVLVGLLWNNFHILCMLMPLSAGVARIHTEVEMARYMYQVAYDEDGWSDLVNKPEDRIEAIRPVVRKLGGKIETAYFCFGEYDLVLIANFPDNTSAAALSMAASAGGSVKAVKTTPLMTIREGMSAMRKAKRSGYRRTGS